jgi:hypothetical protein
MRKNEVQLNRPQITIWRMRVACWIPKATGTNSEYVILIIILRRIYGPIQEGGRWRPRWNNELYTPYNNLSIAEDLKFRRLGWAGHVIRMVEERIPKKVLNGTFHNKRPGRRPRTRWADAVQRDALQLLGVRGWLRVFENRMLRRVFGPKRDEVTGEWRKLHNKELHDLYSLPNIVRVVKSRRMRWAGHMACMGEGRGVHRILVGKPEGKRPLGRPRRRWEDNIKREFLD